MPNPLKPLRVCVCCREAMPAGGRAVAPTKRCVSISPLMYRYGGGVRLGEKLVICEPCLGRLAASPRFADVPGGANVWNALVRSIVDVYKRFPRSEAA